MDGWPSGKHRNCPVSTRGRLIHIFGGLAVLRHATTVGDGSASSMTESNLAVRCRVCGSTSTGQWKARSLDRPLSPDDLRITDARYGVTLGLWRCAQCGFIQADEAELEELTGLYEQISDPEYESGSTARTLQMRWLLTRGLAAHPAAKSLLDIGAGSGLLVAEAKAHGLDAMGVEPSRALVEAARRQNHVEILQGTIPHPSLNGRRFDLVCLVDVIEHVANPVGLLKDSAALLSPGGILFVVTPDVSSLAARVLGKRWWHFRLAHVGYFSRRSLTLAADTAGLEAMTFFRARWFFPIQYLAERLAVYLPLGAVNRAASRFAPLRRLYQQIIPLNPHDSIVCLLRPGKQTA
jgi:2-polyprenyl-3-methyl-5-hydroxy-6-metoxy-1,4-benzoquinol methylase